MKIFLFIIGLYFFLYTPVFTFVGIDSLYFLYPLLLLFFIPKYRKGLYKYHTVFKVWVILFIFIVTRTLFGGEFYFLISTIGILLESILLSYIVVKTAIINNINFERSLLIISSIAAIISTFCLLIPEFNLFVKSILIIKNDYLEDNIFRGFGLADQLTYTYGLIQGLICAYGIIYLKENKWFLYFIPFVILSILINARTGFIPVAISIIAHIVIGKHYRYIFYTFGISIIVIYFWNNFSLEFIPVKTWAWVNEFFHQSIGIFTDGKEGSGTYRVLLDMIILPESFEHWLLGKGYSIFRGVGRGQNSDIGYIIQLNYGGIVYCFLLFYLVFSIYKKSRKTMNNSFYFTMVLSTLIMNFKGTFYAHNSAFSLTVLLVIYSLESRMLNKYHEKTKS